MAYIKCLKPVPNLYAIVLLKCYILTIGLFDTALNS